MSQEYEEKALIKVLRGHVINPLTLGQFGSARRCLICREPWPCVSSLAADLLSTIPELVGLLTEWLTGPDEGADTFEDRVRQALANHTKGTTDRKENAHGS